MVALVLIAGVASAPGQTQIEKQASERVVWSTDSTGPRRFVAVHGRRSAIFGYSQGHAEGGLEVWAYPVQILSSYSVSFRKRGSTTAVEGETVLRRIVNSPEAVTRIYAGPDFIIREKLFVPLEEPGAIITYEVEGGQPVDVDVRFTPVLDLMWPASVGGQEVLWNAASSAYVLNELTHRFRASVGSPDIVAHDETPNSGQLVGRAPGLAFTIRAREGGKSARVIIAGGGTGEDLSGMARKLLTEIESLEKVASEHYSDFLKRGLTIETPDVETNRALQWAAIALEQAQVCNPDLGCGIVAGYGPSRKARRPQYDWFFAGDGMVAVHALLAEGQFERAREELEFILKYQDQKSGMIWHELSQSAGLLDWNKYPYMFVHVDLTFDFLNVVDAYYSATGDQAFVKEHWASIQSAYDYCHSLLDAKDGLPRIPADKEGGREQDALSDELALSASWAEAAQAFGDLAAATDHNAIAEQTRRAGEQALGATSRRYWDGRQNAWISGYTRSGSAVIDRGIGPTSVREKPLFSEAQRDVILDQLAGSDFEADWGTRGRAASAAGYEPNSYASGSVWATGTAGTAQTLWANHRPASALPIWRALVQWSSLDSTGHMHEALAGDFYHEEVESVPEQTWSSALFLASAVHGLLGLKVDGVNHCVTFAPHLPADWGAVTLRHIRVGTSELSFHMSQSATDVQLDVQNEGEPVAAVFAPEIPLGATLRGVRLGKQSIAAKIEEHAQDAHAKVEFALPHGGSLLKIEYGGGVSIKTDPPKLMIGEMSRAIKVTGVNLKGQTYSINFDYVPSAASGFELRTERTLKDVRNATYEMGAPGVYRVTVTPSAQKRQSAVYEHGEVIVNFSQ